jgi:hypothetical protein
MKLYDFEATDNGEYLTIRISFVKKNVLARFARKDVLPRLEESRNKTPEHILRHAANLVDQLEHSS